MASWIKPVALSDVQDGKLYFVGMPPKWEFGTWAFWSEGLNGKQSWTEKPGIALRFEGGDELRRVLRDRPDVISVEVPKDADKRWRARRPKR